MSTTMEFSPLKMETPHSSPHRTPLRASPICSPHQGEEVDPPSYENVGYCRSASSSFCGSGSRSHYSLTREEYRGSPDQASLSRPQQAPVMINHRSRSPSPAIVNFLTSEDSEPGAVKSFGPVTGQNCGLMSSVEYGKRYSGLTRGQPDGGTSRDVFDQLSALTREQTLPESARQPRSLAGSVEILDDMDDDSVVVTKSDDVSSGSDKEEDEDQIECAECNRVFCNLQRYMDHMCCRPQTRANSNNCDSSESKGVSHPNFINNESCLSDTEVFKGRIVYNPNGLAYIIEGSGVDSELELKLSLQPDSIVVKDGMSLLSVDRSIPKIANAVFVSKGDRSIGLHRRCDTREDEASGPVIHRYNVYELRSSEIEELLELFPPYPSGNLGNKPIFMCFLCKLSFGNPRSFLRHAMRDHRMELNEGEKTILCRPNASALIQAFGREKHPTVSVLRQVRDPSASLRDDHSPLHPTNKHNDSFFNRSYVKSSSPDGSYVCQSGFSLDNKMTMSRSPSSDQQDEPMASHRSSVSNALLTNIKREGYLQTSQISSADFHSGSPFLYSSQGDRSSPKRQISPSSILPSPQRATSPMALSGPDPFYSLSSAPGLMMPSAGHQQHLGMATPTSRELQSMGLSVASFMGACDDHPQGRAQGVECPKCDMVLGSTQSLGGHMTMTHSRNSCKTLKCPKCNWHYKYQETLEIHMKEKHPDSDAQCVYCLTNQSHPRLARGESYSCGYKPYRCDVCNYSTTTKGNLSIHMQSDKHINNMQDLANGSNEMKMQPPQSPASSQSLPPSSSTPAPHSASPFPQDESQYKKMKQKQSFRCEVCSYETSVARNLRIHMTSEKHTHNMLVMTQSINHLHQDMTLHQINQMNQFLALNHQEQAARFAAMSPHLNTGMFSYENLLMPTAAQSSGFELPMNLTKENGIEESPTLVSSKDASKLFQCCICNNYGSDSIENVHNHIQYDRTKSGNSDAHVTFSNGAYHCNLCSYKTHLKANFQLHCKTDKHLQKLQVVNHVLEGGAENEWRMAVSGSPMQICCNACSFYANSTHKMQLHMSTIQHESCSQLFRHLQLLEHATLASGSPKSRYYHCTLCSASVRTKQKLIQHSRTSRHVGKEQSLPQGRLSIFDVFLIKEMSEGATIDFEDEVPESNRSGFLRHLKIDEDALDAPESTQGTRDPSNYPKVTSGGGKVTIPPPAHFSTTTAASGSLGTASATDYSVFRGAGHARDRPAGGDPGDDTIEITRTHTLTNKLSGFADSNGTILTGRKSEASPGKDHGQSSHGAAHQNSHGSPTPPLTGVARPRAEPCILCPLCQHECPGAAPLEEHLVQKHSVAPEGIQRLMAMVELPVAPSPATAEAQVAPPTGAPPGESGKSLCAPLSGADLPHRNGDDDIAKENNDDEIHNERARAALDRAMPVPTHTPSPKANEEVATCAPVQATPTTPSWSSTSPQTFITTPATASSPTSSTTAPPLAHRGSATFVTQDIHENRKLSSSDEAKELDLDLLDSDHKELLATEGADLAVQEKLDKEYEDLFRCQTCHKIFINIDQLYCHQNELGHLELKQTPRGPGYLCWKKGCNQYFKTASTLQVHFREIHAKKSMSGCLSVQELESYKFSCGQCNYSFKSMEAMQRHTLIHLMQSVTQCRICSRRVNSVAKMRRHLEIVHGDLSLTDMTIQMEGIESNASLLFSSPAYEQFTAKMLLTAGKSQGKPHVEEEEEVGILPNGLDRKEHVENHEDDIDGDGMSDSYREKQFIEDYINSQSMAEENYKDINRKFKCHRCRVAFTSQKYLLAHNRTSLHRQCEMADKFEDPSRPYRCEICKESFTQKSILTVHFNSVSHLHKLKQQAHLNGDSIFNSSPLSHSTPPSTTPPTHSISSPSSTTMAQINGSFDAASDNASNKPYKCNICKVSYNNQPSIEIHLRSVGHKTKASKLSELIQSGQVDMNQALIEHPDPRAAGKQQAQIVADMIHQQATVQAASNAASYFNLQGMQQGLNVMAQLSLLQGILPASSHHLLASSAQNVLAAQSNAHMEAFYASLNAHNNPSSRDSTRADNVKGTLSKDKFMRSGDGEKIMNMIIKQDGKIEPANSENKMKPLLMDNKVTKDTKMLTKEEELPPNFPHAPIISRPRGFMGRFKPQLHRSLLENFGFECVMHFNEENCVENLKQKVDNIEEDEKKQTENKEDKKESGENEMEVDECKEKSMDEKNKSQEGEIDEKKGENKENLDLPELNKCRCQKCNKDFSNVWVLKNHEEDIHNNFVSPSHIEDFGKKFREDWEKNIPKLTDNDQLGSFQLPSNPPTPNSNAEKVVTTEMPPPPPPSQTHIPPNFDMSQLSQLLPLMGLNMLPMHLPLNLPMNMSLQGFSPLMLPSLDLSQSFLPNLQTSTLVDNPASSQQQLQAAAAAAAQQAQNQKRVRTRISDDQLKVLRQYFDINNSPSEDQINKMSDQTGLPQKVIKHWFRNTLFKERQRNKDSPYNFNNPPSTSIDLDEYDRTGKIPEVKLEPEEEDDSGIPTLHDYKKEVHEVKEEIINDKDDDQDDDLNDNPPLKIDLAPKHELGEEFRKDQDSHSNTSSPSNMSSIPSTPTASAPATPTPMITANALNAANSLTYSLESYAANIARLEAATFQSMGKRANRTRFTDFQIKTLQDYFERNAYPKDDELEHLSKVLGLSARVIVVWFQNARQKARKIYENQPSSENAKEITSPFQRTPGLNYQCKKCNSVFQRYYELIKHQKNSCVSESNNNHKPMNSMIEDDSNYSFSNDDNIFHERQSTPSSVLRERDMQGKGADNIFSSTSNAKLSGTTPGTVSSLIASHTNSSTPTFKCDKCSMTFSRYDMWQDHQKTHVAQAVFTPFSSSSAFGMLQNLAQQEDTTKSPLSVMTSTSSLVPALVSAPLMMGSQQSISIASTPTSASTSPSPSSKRKTDSEDESGEQPRDKRLRTTILPEQLDYLYQQYQSDCNPSRKQLEHIASTVSLKKRVVQVWFQNTRARERKGHYRAHQQLINKRCPFCRALFRAKSALESHLATKHPEEMAKGDINIDLIPDAIIEPPSPHSLTGSSGLGSSASDLCKLFPPGAATTMPNYMAFMSSASGLNLPFSSPTPELLANSSFDDPFFKKYMSELANNLTARQEHSASSTSHNAQTSSSSSVTAHSTPKPIHQTATTTFNLSSRPIEAHKPKNSAPAPSSTTNDDAPLDLSKPISKPSFPPIAHSEARMISSQDLHDRERARELEYLRRLNSLDDSFSETQSEMADNEYMNDVGGSPPSPTLGNSGNLNHSTHTPGSTGKRYRTQMSATQVKVMKHLFQDYKTPTMAECELLGQEIGLAKRVVQVWFQNARAKEKKAKLNSGKPYNAEMDFPKSPEDCKLCNYKYSHKITVQDHIFTKTHIDRVKAFLHSENERDLDLSSSSLSSFSRTPGEPERGQNLCDESLPSGHLSQLQAMGINTNAMGFPRGPGESSLRNAEKSESLRKEKKSDGSISKEEQQQQQQQQVQAAMELAMNAQMLSALGGYMPGLDPTYLSYMYGYFPGMGLPVVQPGLIPAPEHIMAFDPLAYGTPLALLQIPAAAIKSVGEKLTEAGAVLARYTQDCQALADLHSVVSSADLTVAAEATLDVGYICKKCQMVYPARESCVAHQRSVCLAAASSLPKGFEPIMKLEQVQYECRACSERFSTILEFKAHCQQESHKSTLKKFKAKEAARRESTGSPSSSAPYSSSTGKSTSPSVSFTSKLPLISPPNNNNNNNNNNNMSPANSTKPLLPSPAHQLNKLVSSSTPPALFRSLAHNPGFSENAEMMRLKAE